MEFVDTICKLASVIYKCCEQVKANHNQCNRLRLRIEGLIEPLKTIKNQKLIGNCTEVLKQLLETLEKAKQYIEHFTAKNSIFKFIKANKIREEFANLNERLNDVAQTLGLVLGTEQATQLRSIFGTEIRKKEDKEDLENDGKVLKELMMEMNQEQRQRDLVTCQRLQSMNLDVDEIKEDMKELKQMVTNHQKPSVPIKIKEIKWEDLEIDKKSFLETANSIYYRGTYKKFQVAIKRFTHSSADVEEVRKIFHKEAETMNVFDSPNIVRFYGICIHQTGDKTEFLLVMEYCKLGNLRYVLDSEQLLNWADRVQMSLDAAQGLFRLHQTEEKFKLHCCLNSSIFLVDKGLVVKMGGLESAKTETSIRRNIGKKQMGRTIPYASPQQLSDINYRYDKACEVYSFGIVLWEIATRKIPFKDVKDKDLCKMVCDEKYLEPLPDDCSKDLCELIDECRSFEPIERPKAGAIVERLKNIQREMK